MATVIAKKNVFDQLSKNQVLTANKEYEVVKSNLSKFCIVGDCGTETWWPKALGTNEYFK